MKRSSWSNGIGRCVLTIVVGLLLGCDPSPVEPIRAVLTASGEGTATGPSGVPDSFSFQAARYEDGSVTGELRLISEFFAPTPDQSGDVVCLAMIEIGGVDVVAIGASIPLPDPDPGNHGPFFIMLAIDNGDGVASPQDQILPDFPPPESYSDGVPESGAESCEAVLVPPFVLDFFADLDSGEIEVGP
jgi:hypothetical protein